ncbi:MAG: hypothetical protein M1826_006522 [Phylliscum demangeonii]|nr:MAG: hypothetical protein M1826_006522 [Phylliscum demangeonii]
MKCTISGGLALMSLPILVASNFASQFLHIHPVGVAGSGCKKEELAESPHYGILPVNASPEGTVTLTVTITSCQSQIASTSGVQTGANPAMNSLASPAVGIQSSYPSTVQSSTASQTPGTVVNAASTSQGPTAHTTEPITTITVSSTESGSTETKTLSLAHLPSLSHTKSSTTTTVSTTVSAPASTLTSAGTSVAGPISTIGSNSSSTSATLTPTSTPEAPGSGGTVERQSLLATLGFICAGMLVSAMVG